MTPPPLNTADGWAAAFRYQNELPKGMAMEDNASPKQVIYEFERAYFEKLRLAAQVILDAAPDVNFVSDPLEVELAIFRDRVEFMLLLPEAAAGELPWRAGDGDAPHR